jgi:hypothetical protein
MIPPASGDTAAAFFTTYEYLKRTLPKTIDVLEQAPAANHLVSSMGAEIVRGSNFTLRKIRKLTLVFIRIQLIACLQTSSPLGLRSNPPSSRDNQITHPDRRLWARYDA